MTSHATGVLLPGEFSHLQEFPDDLSENAREIQMTFGEIEETVIFEGIQMGNDGVQRD